jgi:hypothetical protein
MQQGLQSFAKRTKSSDGQNAQNSQPSNVGRRANAASLKIPTKKTVLSHDVHVQQAPVQRQSGEQNHPPNAQPQHRRQGQGHNTRQKNDIYDTDAESLDTTVNQRSIIRMKDSQDTQQHGQVLGGGDDEYSDVDESDENEEGDDDEDGDGEGEIGSADDQQQGYQQKELPQQYLEDVGVDPVFIPNYVPQQRGLFDGNNSYPSTTSGPPSNFPHNYHPNQEPSSDHYDQQPDFPSPKPPGEGQPHRQLSQPLPQRTAPAPETKQTMHNHPHVFNRAAELRGIQNTVPNVANRGGSPKQSHPLPLPTSQPPPHSQSVSQVVQPPPVSGNIHQNDGTHANQPHHRGIRQPLGPTRFRSERLAQQPLPVTRTAPIQQVDDAFIQRQSVENGAAYQQAFDHHQSIEEASLQQQFAQEMHAYDQEPVEDYDRPDLFKMDYDHLKNEDFDYVPRATNPVLSEDMLDKPLVERLEHVRQSLDHEDQGRFFKSLPAVEWEEAGDWFLGQFSGIIDRAKKARQAKRKLAAGFEAEIEQRHEHVSKKQRQVHEAMSTMKVQGQILIPKSPMRGSKSPSRRSKTPLRQK